MSSPRHRDPHPAPEEGVTVTRADHFWLVRLETARTTQEYRCASEAEARHLAAALRRASPPRRTG